MTVRRRPSPGRCSAHWFIAIAFTVIWASCNNEIHLVGGACDGGNCADDDTNDTSSAVDKDEDGYSVADGDCLDEGFAAALVNPGAIEDLGDGLDNDCDGETDEATICDCPGVDKDPLDLAAAIELCDPRFLLDVQLNYADPVGQAGYDTVTSQGSNDCLVSQAGCEMLAISSGVVGWPTPNPGSNLGLPIIDGECSPESIMPDPQPEFQGDVPSGLSYQNCWDRTQVKLYLKAPTNAVGFSFDFLFGSAEYPEWVQSDNHNDTFYAIIQYSKLHNWATTNICFDEAGNEIEVDSIFFENDLHPCDETGTGWGPEPLEPHGGSGTTGWLRTSWHVDPGDEFLITFSIHDEDDCAYDSIAFIDNWRWSTVPVETATVPIE